MIWGGRLITFDLIVFIDAVDSRMGLRKAQPPEPSSDESRRRPHFLAISISEVDH